VIGQHRSTQRLRLILRDDEATLTAAIVTLASKYGEDLLTLASDHNLCTIAEGVETVEQVALLTGMGVDGMQGFKLSTPLTADESLSQITAAAA
jgi:EAL domain-containing protein (putative c-di-GMP-specific phosphodiesterase class I)